MCGNKNQNNKIKHEYCLNWRDAKIVEESHPLRGLSRLRPRVKMKFKENSFNLIFICIDLKISHRQSPLFVRQVSLSSSDKENMNCYAICVFFHPFFRLVNIFLFQHLSISSSSRWHSREKWKPFKVVQKRKSNWFANYCREKLSIFTRRALLLFNFIFPGSFSSVV